MAAKKRSAAKKTPAEKTVTKKTTAKKAPAKKAPAKKAPAKRASTKKTTAKKSAPRSLARYDAKRDFEKTAEPSGEARAPKSARLRFVIQKHAASHLHFDWRLELDGVMKSWAVPKGPSLAPGVRRLAMEVEDHPIAYNTFEGTIPKGQYGGGTVMLWDQGTYEPTDGGGEDALRRGYEKGKLDITLHGVRLGGAWTLVRTRGEGERAQWLLIKRSDAYASATIDAVAVVTTSVVSGLTMEELAEGGRVWQSNRA